MVERINADDFCLLWSALAFTDKGRVEMVDVEYKECSDESDWLWWLFMFSQ